MDAPYTHQVAIKCICCSKEIKHLDGSPSGRADQACYDDGLVHTVVAGYGSRHDTEQLLCGICDDCIEKAKEDGRLIEFWNQFDGYVLEPKPAEDNSS